VKSGPRSSFFTPQANDLRSIGIDLRVEPREDIFDRLDNPRMRVPMAIDIAWLKDIPSASNFIAALFLSSNIEVGTLGNYSLVGASAAQLEGWGYHVTEVPSIDARIAQCDPANGTAQFQCWAELDQYLMTQVVPWVPLISESHVEIVPARIFHYSYDQFADQPALDQIALQGSGG